MTAPRFAEQLNEQIANEFAAHLQYLACAIYYDSQTMPQTAAHFYGQAMEEHSHALMMVQFLLDTGALVRLPSIEGPVTEFADIVAPVALALEQEKRVTQEVYALTKTARDEVDFAAEQFMQWFIKEQVEEVASMSDLYTVVCRSTGDIRAIEEFAGAMRAGEIDPTAPPAAGAGRSGA
jgi:ferritin